MTKSHKLDLVAIALVGVLAYGTQVLWLGFFQDDWNFIFFSSYKGNQGLFEFLLQDGRPGASWVYMLGFALLGYKPVAWQIFTITLRLLTTIVFWLILNNFWGNNRYGNLVTAILFLVYPFFTLQPLSVAYAPHFAAFLSLMLSLFFMIKAQNKGGSYFIYTIPAILLTFLHLFTVEYFIGLELLRPIILWFTINLSANNDLISKTKKTLLHWAPYLIADVTFIIWRSLFISNLGIRNDPIASIFGPNSVLVTVIKNLFADLALMLVSTWSGLITPDMFVIGPIRNFYVLAISILAGLIYYFLLKQATLEETTSSNLKSVLFAGAIIIFFGMAATYSVGYIIHIKISPWNSRFALPALPGLALVALGTLEAIITQPKIRHIFLSVLIGLLVGYHNANTLSFKSAWEKQERLYQQLMWRAPSIESGTAIIANEEILGYMGDYPLSFAINTLYEAKPAREIPYWFFAVSENFNFSINDVLSSKQIHNERAFTVFNGKPSNALFITYEPENGQCLWVLRPEEAEYKYLDSNMKVAALASSNKSIQNTETDSHIFKSIIKENKDTWCYFYQKAELARQDKDWQAIITLWESAKSSSLRPYNGFEFLPFIEAYANIGDWENAYKLSERANVTTKAMYFLLCPTWQRLDTSTPFSEQKNEYVEKSYNNLKCVKP